MSKTPNQSDDIYFNPIKKPLFKRVKAHKTFYLMLLPCLVFFLVFSYLPMSGLVLAFKTYGFNTGIFGGEFVGLEYFEEFFSDPRAKLYIVNTLIISFIKLILYLPFPILLALMFNEVKNSRLRGISQSVLYLPHFLSWVIVISLVSRLLAPDTGILNQMISAFGGDGGTFWLMEEENFYPIVFLSYLWKNIGWDSIIYFATIVSISPTLYEAAAIDGANRFQQTIHITLPGIKLTIVILFILSLSGVMSAGFDQIYLLQMPGNLNVSETIDTYIVTTGLMGGEYGYGTAVGLMQGIVGLILTIIVNKVTSKRGHGSLW